MHTGTTDDGKVKVKVKVFEVKDKIRQEYSMH